MRLWQSARINSHGGNMKKSWIALVLVSSTGLFSCASKTGTGALIGTGAGAGVGAGVGALIGGGKGAAIGAGVGAVAGGITGAAIGAKMDRQQKELEEKMKSAKIERAADNQINVRFDAGILFDTGSSQLKPDAQAELQKFAEVLNQYPENQLTIEGHTDSTGSKSLNQTLSEKRAGSVKNQLQSARVDGARMATFGYADTRPIASNDTVEGRAQNRRVEIKIVQPATQANAQ